jgi:hypothetical protein
VRPRVPSGVVTFVIAVALLTLGFMAGGLYLLNVQLTGERTTARISHCTRSGYRHANYACTGFWVHGGSLVFGNGHVVSGTVDGASRGDVGKSIAVRVSNGHAYRSSLRVPIVLLAIAAAFALYGGFEVRRQIRSRA